MLGIGINVGIGGSVARAAPDALLTGLLAWYRANGTDRSGNGNNLTAVGSPTTTTGLSGVANAAMLCNPGTDYWHKAGGLFTSPSFSMSCFLLTTTSDLVLSAVQQSDVDFLPIQALRQFGANFESFDVPGGPTTASVATPNAYTHLGGTWDGTTAKIYVNGILRNSSVTVNNYDSLTDFALGYAGGAAVSIQNVGVWTSALTAANMLTLSTGHDPTV